MKTKINLILISSFFCFFSQFTGVCQTIAIGHISAEVVEATSASSSALTNFDLNCRNRGNTGSSAYNAEHINMGSMQINSAPDVACELTIKPAVLTDDSGNDFSLDPIVNYKGTIDSHQIIGTQTIEIAGRATMNTQQASGLYQGTYTLVFAYN
jgi:hypothetical protein